MRAFLGVQAAFDDVWDVDIDKRANAAVKRLRALIGLLAIGLAQIGTVFLSAVAGAADVAAISRVLVVAGALAINIAVVTTMYRYLTAALSAGRCCGRARRSRASCSRGCSSSEPFSSHG